MMKESIQHWITQGGIHVHRTMTPISNQTALDHIYQHIDTHQGALFVSNYEYPDRYSRWDIGFVFPALEIISKKRNFSINALNANGEMLLSIISPILQEHPHLISLHSHQKSISGTVQPMPDFFPEEERSKQPSIFSIIRAIHSLFYTKEDSHLGLYGAFGYDLVFQFETLEAQHERTEEMADCHLFFPIDFTVVDHQKEQGFKISYQIETPQGTTDERLNTGMTYSIITKSATGKIECDHQQGEFEKKVSRIREGCQQGDFFEVVLSQSFSTPCDQAPTALFQRIKETNPSPYTFFINMGREQLLGASPEMYVRITGNRFETSPISGTVPIGEDPMETAERIKYLISSEKEESELTMCTDVDRNDMSRICEPGSVKLIGRRLIEYYSRLVHTVDHVEGILLPQYDAIDALLCHMWACTVTGSPKPIAMQTIENMENSPRGWYSGCIGFLTFNGNLNTGMTLRTTRLKDGIATIRAGATLLYESDPASEEKETHTKASAFLEAILGRTKKSQSASTLQKTGLGKTILFVDNQDSFVHTLGNYVRQTGAKVITLRAGFPQHLLDEIQPDLVFISPGPKAPKDLGIPTLVGTLVKKNIPIFGVCLGHQGIAEYFGAKLKVFEIPYHGKPSEITHTNQGIFKELPSPFTAGRYHSLYVDPATLPECLTITAQTDDGIIMGLEHKELPICSVQFHPESILTLKNQTGISLIHQMVEYLTQTSI